ncbi:MAG: NAD-dependent epimerase/dehydratase family protein [Myxococcales bacterium]|nr:MAG: NAD-dependent epimerase/dehydratase family protein [Myxococcales bacterium]
MKVILFGASGMVGQGALRELLADDEVTNVLAIGRSATGRQHPKLKELIQADVADLSMVEQELRGYDACLFCLGVSAVGMTEPEYKRVTYDLTLRVAQTLERLSPRITFVYVSGNGTDSTERGRVMWARVKGATENALLAMPFARAYMLRPAFIRPLHGVVSKTGWYRALYALAGPVYPLLKRLFPGYVTTTEELGQAMLHLVKRGSSERVLENRDISALGASPALPT